MAWNQNRVTDMLQIAYPIFLGPMAGGPTTPQLAAAVSNAGGLGSVGAGYLTPEQIRTVIAEIRALTDKPFAINLFIPEPQLDEAAEQEKIAQVSGVLQKYRAEVGLGEAPPPSKFAESFDEQMAVILEEKVPVFSCTFGIPAPKWMQALKANGTTVIGTATTVREGIELERAGVDMIVGQGGEAGGHRGTFLAPADHSLIGTMALIPALVDHVSVPVIAAGGIMDGRGVLAALALGAEAAVMGTAFLTCPESGANPAHQAEVLASTEESTTITRVFSGRAARGIRNRFLTEMEAHEPLIPAYPIQNALTRELRAAAGKQQRPEFLSLWAGQGTRLSRSLPAGELFAQVVEQVERFVAKLGK